MLKITTCVLRVWSYRDLKMECCEKRDGGDPSFVRLIISSKPLNLFGPAPPEYKRPAELRCEGGWDPRGAHVLSFLFICKSDHSFCLTCYHARKRPEFFLYALHPNSHQNSLHIFVVIFRQENKINGVGSGAEKRQLSNTFSKVRLFVS